MSDDNKRGQFFYLMFWAFCLWMGWIHTQAIRGIEDQIMGAWAMRASVIVAVFAMIISWYDALTTGNLDEGVFIGTIAGFFWMIGSWFEITRIVITWLNAFVFGGVGLIMTVCIVRDAIGLRPAPTKRVAEEET